MLHRWCSFCGAAGAGITIRHDDYGVEYIHCAYCGERQYVPDPPKPEIPPKDPLEIEIPKVRPQLSTSQKQAQRRYRQSELFKKTNARIQARYRDSLRGQEILRQQRRRSQVLRKLEKALEEYPDILSKSPEEIRRIMDSQTP